MINKDALFLAIDQSTSATKAILFNSAGVVVDQASLPHRQIYPKPGWVEHDAEVIYQNTLQAVEELFRRQSDHWEKVSFVSITNQRETFVIFEKGTGQPLYHAIVWQCRRGDDICAEFSQSDVDNLIRQKTGLKIDTYFPGAKIKWLFENEPGIYDKVRRGEALLGTIDSYLIYRLTNGQVFATDHSNASRTLLYDIHHLDWDKALAEIFNVPLDALPQVRSSNAAYGSTDFEGKLPSRLPICGVMGDSQAALFAQRCFSLGEMKVTFGTGSSILLNIGNTPKILEKGILTTIAWVLDDKPTYALEGITNFTGAVVQWLRDQLGLIESAEETEALAKSIADNGGVFLVPAFVGLGTPYWRSDAKAAILGLTPQATRAHVVRAGLESIAYIINDVLGHMASESGIELTEVFADGGATRNQFLMQFTSDITKMRLTVSETPELSALGAVFAGMLGTGLVSSTGDLTEIPRKCQTYTPKIDEEKRKVWLRGWKQAVRKTLS